MARTESSFDWSWVKSTIAVWKTLLIAAGMGSEASNRKLFGAARISPERWLIGIRVLGDLGVGREGAAAVDPDLLGLGGDQVLASGTCLRRCPLNMPNRSPAPVDGAGERRIDVGEREEVVVAVLRTALVLEEVGDEARLVVEAGSRAGR